MDRSARAKACAAALAGAMVLAGCSGKSENAGNAGNAGPASVQTSPPVSGAGSDLQQQYVKVVDAVLPSVVKIQTDQGEGSGVVFDAQGDIVTNAHVVAGAKKIQVTSSGGGSPLNASMVGAFTADDLAVIKVGGGSLKPASWGESSKAQVGQIVLAMGNPLGLAGSVTNGIVSALHRTVSTKGEGDFQGSTIADAIQTSADINPGNSGGALVTLDGQVIGIPTAAASDPQIGAAAPGIGFATPSDTVKRIVPQLIESGKVSNSGRAALGVAVRTIVDPQTGRRSAVAVVEVQKGGGAAKAGIQKGDLILSVNGTATPDQTVLTTVLTDLRPGETVKVEIQKPDGSKKQVQVTLGELPGGG
ncbi:S1C family serine protease [Actinomadura citrea]|uniref:Putative serine protease PepD n=1 Tax=Actinomadura citrea TaxID=46158 RepID=A0A7Y9G7W1_9ACTN|nr:trypsin-like peptidase domain-containing protein [Actinomadura citrea]NYE11599.1 putative serine protease PepD [Actinomadura citrea]GGT87153.1 serine protease [Actinomadura citrea]